MHPDVSRCFCRRRAIIPLHPRASIVVANARFPIAQSRPANKHAVNSEIKQTHNSQTSCSIRDKRLLVSPAAKDDAGDVRQIYVYRNYARNRRGWSGGARFLITISKTLGGMAKEEDNERCVFKIFPLAVRLISM